MGYGSWALVLRDQPLGQRRALYHGLGAAPAADTVPVVAGSDFFLLAAGAASFFFAGCSFTACSDLVARSREAVRSSRSFFRSSSLRSPSVRACGRSPTAGNSGAVAGRAGVCSGRPPTTGGTLSAIWVVQPEIAVAAAKTATIHRPLNPVETLGRAMNYTRAALMLAPPVRPESIPALLTQLFGLYDKIFR